MAEAILQALVQGHLEDEHTARLLGEEMTALRSGLGEAAFEDAFAAGRSLPPDAIVAYALAEC
jgi:hypothetical protein